MPTMTCSLMEKGPGLREKENRPSGTVHAGRTRASRRPSGSETRMTKKTGNAAVVCEIVFVSNNRREQGRVGVCARSFGESYRAEAANLWARLAHVPRRTYPQQLSSQQ